MRESAIWKIVFWTITATIALMVVVSLDTGFLSLYLGSAAIPVSTGERIEILVTQQTPLSGARPTDLYWLNKDGSVEKKTSFEQMPQCITTLDNRLFITFANGESSIFENGKWLRGVSRPDGLDIVDAAPHGNTLYAFGLSDQGRKIAVRALGDTGWTVPVEPFAVGETVRIAGTVNVAGGIEVLYLEAPEAGFRRIDPSKVSWYHVLFDSQSWGEARPLTPPAGFWPNVGERAGELAFVLIPEEKDAPVRIASVKEDLLAVETEVTTKGLGKIVSAWLVSLAQKEYLLIVAASSIWQVEIDGSSAGRPMKILSISSASKVRSRVYTGLLAVAAVVLVALGSAWFYVRVRSLRREKERRT